MCGTICACFLLLLILGNSIFSHWKLPLLSKPYCFSGHQTWIPSAWTWKQDDQLKLFCDSKRNPPKTLNQPTTHRPIWSTCSFPSLRGNRSSGCPVLVMVLLVLSSGFHFQPYLGWWSLRFIFWGWVCGQLNHLPLVIGWCVHIHTQSPHFG